MIKVTSSMPRKSSAIQRPPKLGWYWFSKQVCTSWHIVRVVGDAKNPSVRDTWGISMEWDDWPDGDWEAILDRNRGRGE